jgi:hypothetical protein
MAVHHQVSIVGRYSPGCSPNVQATASFEIWSRDLPLT